MNRLREIKNKINRNNRNIGIQKLSDGYYVCFGTNFNNSGCIGPLSYREAIFKAYRISFPRKKTKVTITTVNSSGVETTDEYFID